MRMLPKLNGMRPIVNLSKATRIRVRVPGMVSVGFEYASDSRGGEWGLSMPVMLGVMSVGCEYASDGRGDECVV